MIFKNHHTATCTHGVWKLHICESPIKALFTIRPCLQQSPWRPFSRVWNYYDGSANANKRNPAAVSPVSFEAD